MVDTIRIWDFVEGIEESVKWRYREKGSNDFFLRRWRGRSGAVRVFAYLGSDGRVMVSAEASLPRLVKGSNAEQLSVDDVELGCQALIDHIIAALPAIDSQGPRRWKISRLDLSHDLTLPEGETARGVVRRLAESLIYRPRGSWLTLFHLEEPLWNTLRLVHRGRNGMPAKRQGSALIAYDKGGEGGFPATRKLRVEARLRYKPLASLMDGEFFLDRLPAYLTQYGLSALRSRWDDAVRARATLILGQELAEVIRVPKIPERAQAAHTRWRAKVLSSQASFGLKGRD